MIWKCEKCQTVVELTEGSSLHFCPICGKEIELSDPIRLLKWDESNSTPNGDEANASVDISAQESPKPQPNFPTAESVSSSRMESLNNSLEPPLLRLRTPAAVNDTLEQPIQVPIASYRECPFCNAPMKEGSDICEICGRSFDKNGDLDTAPPAGPWQRWAARSLDYSLESVLIVLFLLLLFITLLFVSRHLRVALISEEKLVFFLSFFLVGRLRTVFLTAPFVFMLDSLEYALFGNTIGKWLFGVKVIDLEEQPLSAGAFFKRNMQVYWGGYGLAFPIVNVLTFYTQYKFVSQGLSATYDHRLGFLSIRYHETPLKTLLGIVLLCLLPIITAASMIVPVLYYAH